MTNIITLGKTETNKDVNLDLTHNVLQAEVNGITRSGYSYVIDNLVREMMDNDKDLEVFYFDYSQVRILGTKQNSLYVDYKPFEILDFCSTLQDIVADIEQRVIENCNLKQTVTKQKPKLLVFTNIQRLIGYEGEQTFNGVRVKDFIKDTLGKIFVYGNAAKYHIITYSAQKGQKIEYFEYNTEFKAERNKNVTVNSCFLGGEEKYNQEMSKDRYKRIYG